MSRLLSDLPEDVLRHCVLPCLTGPEQKRLVAAQPDAALTTRVGDVVLGRWFPALPVATVRAALHCRSLGCRGYGANVAVAQLLGLQLVCHAICQAFP